MPGMEAAIRELLESRSAAMGSKNIEWLMSLYSDIVYFDLVPPLRYVGSNALRERFLDWFPRWSGPIGQELGQLDVAAGDAVAAAWMLIRARGILKTGAKVDYWVRVVDLETDGRLRTSTFPSPSTCGAGQQSWT